MSYIIGIDIGGTCTDCVAVDDGGRFNLSKTFSTPPDFSIGIVNGLELLAASVGTSLDSLLATTSVFLHSTTVAENAIVDGTLAKAGLVTTRGFEDTLCAMRGGYGRWSGLTELQRRDPVRTDKPVPLIPNDLIGGVDARGFPDGRVRACDGKELERVVGDLLDAGVESLGICLLWSFLAPDLEREVEAVVKRIRPDVFVSSSSRLTAALGEYERTSTTALNARLGPVVATYLEKLHRALTDHGFNGVLLVMQAYGGLVPVSEASARPVGLIESGPVGGVLGSKVVGEWLGARDVIAADMGGTTFKVGIIRDSSIEYERESMVLRYHFAAPKFDIASLGLAGGSVVSVDPEGGVPKIGPRSAGSFPGPVCYGNGGREPTVTDVDAILGYLHPGFFLGGRELDIDAARRAFVEIVAGPLGMSQEEASARVYRLTNSHIFDMLHRATVQRGLDPRGFTLVSIGGTAGMHVMSYASRLGVSRVVVPSTASVHSAAGLVYSDIVHEEQATNPMRLPVEPSTVESIFETLRAGVFDQFERDGYAPDSVGISRSVDMRYARQAHMVTVPVDGGPVDAAALSKTIDRFEDLYRRRYGAESGLRDAGIELVVFRVRGTGRVPKPRLQTHPRRAGSAGAAVVERRLVWVDDLGIYSDVNGYDWERIRPGDVIQGPAIVWTPNTTIVLRSADKAEMDERLNLVLTPSGSPLREENNGHDD